MVQKSSNGEKKTFNPFEMKTNFGTKLTVKDSVQSKRLEKIVHDLKNIIRPNYNDEWLDESKHFKEAAEDVLKYLFDNNDPDWKNYPK